MVEASLFTYFSRLAQAYVWTKTKKGLLRSLDSALASLLISSLHNSSNDASEHIQF